MILLRLWSILAMALVSLSACAGVSHADKPDWVRLVTREQSASDPRRRMAVWVSGDGGWGRMEREETRRLAAAGIPTLGVDSLHYFLIKRTPRRAATDIAAQIERQARVWHTHEIIFVGFSYGADIGPLIVRDLPANVRARIDLAAFLSPSRRANMRVTPASWLGIGIGPRVWPVMRSLAPTPVLCIGGAGVFRDICPDRAPPAGMKSVRLSGGHELTAHYDRIAALLIR